MLRSVRPLPFGFRAIIYSNIYVLSGGLRIMPCRQRGRIGKPFASATAVRVLPAPGIGLRHFRTDAAGLTLLAQARRLAQQAPMSHGTGAPSVRQKRLSWKSLRTCDEPCRGFAAGLLSLVDARSERLLKKCTTVLVLCALCISPAAHAQPASSFFVPNQGQWDGDFLFRYQGPGVACFVTRTGMTLDLREHERTPPFDSPHEVGGRLGPFPHSVHYCLTVL